MKKTIRLGVHVSVAGGLHLGLQRAHELGCETVQIFSHNPRGWAVKELAKEDITEFRQTRSALSIDPVFIHATYLVNAATDKPELMKKSLDMIKTELDRADALGADYVVLHPGTAVDGDLKAGRERAIELLNRLSEQGSWKAGLLLENTATGIAARLEHLAEILDATGAVSKGVCLDTCHAFQAGYDLRASKDIDALASISISLFGQNGVRLLHLNDSKATEPGLGKDRHEHIGKGGIGQEGFKSLVTHKAFRAIPLVLETPKKSPDDDFENLAAIRALAG